MSGKLGKPYIEDIEIGLRTASGNDPRCVECGIDADFVILLPKHERVICVCVAHFAAVAKIVEKRKDV